LSVIPFLITGKLGSRGKEKERMDRGREKQDGERRG
jgi:hypothetical protein